MMKRRTFRSHAAALIVLVSLLGLVQDAAAGIREKVRTFSILS
jgi:hypothetical protein